MSSAPQVINMHASHLASPDFGKMTAQNKFDVAATLLSAVFLIVALGLAIRYAVHPLPPLIPITPNFSISLPLLVCSSAGCVMAVTFIVQMIRHKQLKVAFEKGIGRLISSFDCLKVPVRFAIHPGARAEGETEEMYRQKRKDDVESAELFIGPCESYQTRDQVTLRGYWHLSGKNKPTVILFHGNAMNAEDMAPFWGSYYKESGFNVLMAEYRGYGLSEGKAGGSNQEMEAYFDAEAALKFVLRQGVSKDKIIAHGFSLGGAYAASLACFYGINYVVLDHAFTSCAAAIRNVSPFSEDLAAYAVQAAYEQKKEPKDSSIPGATDLQTDGFNSHAKLAQCKPQTFVIQGKTDHIMHLDFGKQLVQAAYPDDAEKQVDYLAVVEGGHDMAPYFTDNSAQIKFSIFLEENV
jgi:esterase/lipase